MFDSRKHRRFFLLFPLLVAALAAVWAAQGRGETAEQQLERLARGLGESGAPAALEALAKFSREHDDDALGARAALALGRHFAARSQHAEARRWFRRAQADPLLAEYALEGEAAAARAAGAQAEALALLARLRHEYPESVLSETAVEALASLALALGQPARALEELEAYGRVESRPALILLRARALEQARRPEAAAAHYATLWYEFPLSTEARAAGQRIPQLRQALGKRFPEVTILQRVTRAGLLFEARRWTDARSAWADLEARLSGAEKELARLRVAQCRQRLGAGPAPLAALELEDAELDAERLHSLVAAHRARQQIAAMLEVVEQLAERYPASRWTEEALFAAGNHFWVNLERGRASEFYSRVERMFPRGANAEAAQWRVAWEAYLERRPAAAKLLEEHLRRFPGSRYAENALYWLGRLAERAGNAAAARSYFAKIAERYPHTYFALQAAERQRALGPGAAELPAALRYVPAPPEPPALGPIPPEARAHWARAAALRSIGLDGDAERELRAGHSLSGSPRLLLEAARAALDAGRYWQGISAARRAYPRLELVAADAPEDVWRTLYPVAYADRIEHFAERRQLDPMILLGLVRQESLFQRNAVSRAGAVGLMQIMPPTGRQLARREGVAYSRAQLFQPEYNLRLGTTYFADLVRTFSSLEEALAAYNAGRSRVHRWNAERQFEEPAEFVESIPFTETREYVQIVLRNAEVYRRLYSGAAPAGTER